MLRLGLVACMALGTRGARAQSPSDEAICRAAIDVRLDSLDTGMQISTIDQMALCPQHGPAALAAWWRRVPLDSTVRRQLVIVSSGTLDERIFSRLLEVLEDDKALPEDRVAAFESAWNIVDTAAFKTFGERLDNGSPARVTGRSRTSAPTLVTGPAKPTVLVYSATGSTFAKRAGAEKINGRARTRLQSAALRVINRPGAPPYLAACIETVRKNWWGGAR